MRYTLFAYKPEHHDYRHGDILSAWAEVHSSLTEEQLLEKWSENIFHAKSSNNSIPELCIICIIDGKMAQFSFDFDECYDLLTEDEETHQYLSEYERVKNDLWFIKLRAEEKARVLLEEEKKADEEKKLQRILARNTEETERRRKEYERLKAEFEPNL